MTLSVDGKQVLTTDKIEEHLCKLAWSALKLSPYLMAFGNEETPSKQSAFDWVDESERKRAGPPESLTAAPDVILPKNITPGVTGYSIWRSLEIRYDDPKTGERRVSWRADRDRFPDQYQLDRLIEIDATVSGMRSGIFRLVPARGRADIRRQLHRRHGPMELQTGIAGTRRFVDSGDVCGAVGPSTERLSTRTAWMYHCEVRPLSPSRRLTMPPTDLCSRRPLRRAL